MDSDVIKITIAVGVLLYYLIKKSGRPALNKDEDTSNSQTQSQAEENPFSNMNLFQNKSDAFSQPASQNTHSNMGHGSQNFYCKFCGKKFSTIQVLIKDTCFKHPNAEQGLQKHIVFEGKGKPNVGFY